MPKKPIDILENAQVAEKFKNIYNDKVKFPRLEDVADQLKTSGSSIRRWAKKLKKAGHELTDRSPAIATIKEKEEEQKPTSDELIEIRKLKDQVSTLRTDLREAEKRAVTSISLKELIHDMKLAPVEQSPNWLSLSPDTMNLHGIPTIFLSDIHFDEHVDAAQIGFVNEFNREIAVKRIQHTFQSGIELLMNYVAKPKYEGIIVALGGDIITGTIHEELAETNDYPVLKSVVAVRELLYQGIKKYADIFGKVFVPCVVGNHGRLHKKPRMKNRVFDNYEWLIYQDLASRFQGDDRVSFLIPDGPDAVFQVYDHTFLLTHGDQFRGGSGISGIFTPLHLGLHRKQGKQSAIHCPFDVMMLGHFHQYIHTNNIIVNGSIKGYCEFANLCNFTFQRPMQALWINHPKNGMTFRFPILCDSYPGGYKSLQRNKGVRVL